MSSGLQPALILALDGASFDVIEPLARAGRLPNLSAWMAGGSAAPLPSTVPPMTFPAWSSFMTGLPPGGGLPPGDGEGDPCLLRFGAIFFSYLFFLLIFIINCSLLYMYFFFDHSTA